MEKEELRRETNERLEIESLEKDGAYKRNDKGHARHTIVLNNTC